ncbi:MAG: ribosome assembly RNA-binding protein YhbY [Desulfuromonadaceae bacterium]|nr:ribosome assembly RNA-binding protein YhbY [Desulfuromonadaceae bacterium]
MKALTGKQVRYLRGLGHHLQPVVMVGKEEINDALLESLEEALTHHELIKVRIQEGCLLDRHQVAEQLSQAAGCAVAQVLGRTLLLYRPSEQQRIELP